MASQKVPREASVLNLQHVNPHVHFDVCCLPLTPEEAMVLTPLHP